MMPQHATLKILLSKVEIQRVHMHAIDHRTGDGRAGQEDDATADPARGPIVLARPRLVQGNIQCALGKCRDQYYLSAASSGNWKEFSTDGAWAHVGANTSTARLKLFYALYCTRSRYSKLG